MRWQCLRPAALLIGSLMVVLPSPTGADTDLGDAMVTRERVIVPAGRTIDRDYFAVAEHIEIAGTINGDAHLVARSIVVSGTINGDLLAAGGTVEITGSVTHDARLLAGEMTLRGKVARNVSVIGRSITLTGGATVDGGAMAIGLTLQVGASIAKNLTVAGPTVVLNGPVGGSVNAAARSLDVVPGARIAGHLSYLGDRPPNIHDPTSVAGPVTRRAFPTLRWPWPDDVLEVWPWIRIGLLVLSALSSLILGLLLIALFPHATDRTVLHLLTRPFGAAGVGLCFCVLGPFVVLALSLTIVGLPIAFVLGTTGLVIVYLARLFAMLATGHVVLASLGRDTSARTAFLIGLLIYYGLRLVPFLGDALALVATTIGAGAILRAALSKEHDHGPLHAAPRLRAQDFE